MKKGKKKSNIIFKSKKLERKLKKNILFLKKSKFYYISEAKFANSFAITSCLICVVPPPIVYNFASLSNVATEYSSAYPAAPRH